MNWNWFDLKSVEEGRKIYMCTYVAGNWRYDYEQNNLNSCLLVYYHPYQPVFIFFLRSAGSGISSRLLNCEEYSKASTAWREEEEGKRKCRWKFGWWGYDGTRDKRNISDLGAHVVTLLEAVPDPTSFLDPDSEGSSLWNNGSRGIPTLSQPTQLPRGPM